MGRVDHSIRNIKYAIAGQALGLIVNFVVRMAFIRTLNIEYLGINGLFSSILTMLSLTEMGISTAITYNLYRPIAENNINKIVALMQLYKKAYSVIGAVVAILGIIITPFLEYLLTDTLNIPYLKLIFLLYVTNSSLSYLFSYKRSIIVANQKNFIITSYHYAINLLMGLSQIVILFSTHNFILYFICQVVFTYFENFMISRKADSLYPYIRVPKQVDLDKETTDEIVRNIKALFLHRIGSIVVNGTDNLIISKVVNIMAVGIYSNYLMVTTALNSIFAIFFQSVTASIGNLAITETYEKKNQIFGVLNFVGFWFYGFTSICLFILLNTFMVLWLGTDYIFSTQIIFIIVLNYYIIGIRKACLTFRDALGLYWYDRYKPLAEAILNIFLSLILGIKFGVSGVLLGTTISTLATSCWIEPYILYKYGLNGSVKPFFVTQIKYSLVTLITGYITFIVCELLPLEGTFNFAIKLFICVIVSNFIFILLFNNDNFMKYCVKLICYRVRK